MTYAQKMGKSASDWLAFLSREEVDRDVLDLARKACLKWYNCPLAHMEGSADIERDEYGIPVDRCLRTLSARFFCEIEAWYRHYGYDYAEHARRSAMLTYYQIQVRLDQVLSRNQIQTTLF